MGYSACDARATWETSVLTSHGVEKITILVYTEMSLINLLPA